MRIEEAWAPRSAWGLPSLLRAPRLRLLVLAVADRCDQRCVHCQIWMGPQGRRSLTLAERLTVVEEALAGGLEAALLTGGEPLLSADLWPVAERLHAGGVRLMLATNGMLLDRYASAVGAMFDEVYVSLDGASPTTHDRQRGASAFERVARGIRTLRETSEVLIVARSTLHARNLHELEAIVETARRIGFHHVSFLPLDASSSAFGGLPETRLPVVPSVAQVKAFEVAIERMAQDGLLGDGFVLESPAKLRRLARHLRASAGEVPFERPPCDAPWWSSVVEADGTLRPCFFHEGVGDAREGLHTVRSSERYRAALSFIRAPNATCDRCVCPKMRSQGLRAKLEGIRMRLWA